MFGLMQPKSCSSGQIKKQHNPNFHRIHYCGTCKAIGQQFDQSSRLLLNFDTVFLAELLSLLNNEETTTWEANLQKVNTCFSMPKDQLPFSLQYAAATNSLLSELKVKDNISDQRSIYAKLTHQYFSNSFKKTTKYFRNWNIDLTNVYQAATR